jgi:hypothetical protein
MFDFSQLQQNPFFQEKSFQRNDIVFDEWAIDTCLYVVIEWEFLIEKHISSNDSELKELALLHKGDIFWEWSFSQVVPKEVRIRAVKEGKLLFIDIAKDMENCLQQFPALSLQILKEIISLTNKRLLVSNKEATVNYEITKQINAIETIDTKWLTWLFDSISKIYRSDYLLYLEKKEFIEHTLVIRYDTRDPWKFQNKVITFPDDFKKDVLEESGINLWKNTLIQKISIWKIVLGYIVFWNKETDFTDSDRRSAHSIANNLVWVLRQKKLLDEERDRNYIKNI